MKLEDITKAFELKKAEEKAANITRLERFNRLYCWLNPVDFQEFAFSKTSVYVTYYLAEGELRIIPCSSIKLGQIEFFFARPDEDLNRPAPEVKKPEPVKVSKKYIWTPAKLKAYTKGDW